MPARDRHKKGGVPALERLNDWPRRAAQPGCCSRLVGPCTAGRGGAVHSRVGFSWRFGSGRTGVERWAPVVAVRSNHASHPERCGGLGSFCDGLVFEGFDGVVRNHEFVMRTNGIRYSSIPRRSRYWICGIADSQGSLADKRGA